MRVLVVAPGSSSPKLSVVDGGVKVAARTLDDWDGAPTRVLLIEAREDVEIAHQVDLARVVGLIGGGSRG
jgi:hypothetical protein